LKAAFWAAEVADDLSQGDVVAGVWIGSQFTPRASLVRGPTQKGGIEVWRQGTDLALDPKTNYGHFLARGRESLAMVLTESCEIDKKQKAVPVLVAPLIALEMIKDEKHRDTIRQERRHAFFPIEALQGKFEESYVDLRAITYLPRDVLDGADRVASVTSSGVQRLAAHIVGFFTRIDLNSITVTSK
jgi:hypothetical protein